VDLNVVPVRLVSAGGHAAAAWALGLRFALPIFTIERAGWHRCISANGDLSIPPGPVDLTLTDVAGVRELAAFTPTPPASSRLPVSYQRVPGWARALVASVIGRRHRRRVSTWAKFPGWPLDLTADLLADIAGVACHEAARSPTPVVLTHDIDSAEGLAALLREFLPLEEAAGARSTSFIVPCGWTLDEAIVADVHARGHEIGVHGYDHANRTPFASDDERRRRLDAPRAFASRYGVAGYRAPSLLRTRALLRDLAPRYKYDSSVPTSGGLFPVPNNGCASARPFTLEGIVELPLSMPRDGALRFLGYSPDEIARLWIDCAEQIAASGGLVVVLTHCERRFSGTAAMQRAYRQLIEHVASSARFRFARAVDAAVPDAL